MKSIWYKSRISKAVEDTKDIISADEKIVEAYNFILNFDMKNKQNLLKYYYYYIH